MLIGTQDFEYVLDNEFFKNIEGEDVQKGKVKVKLTVKRTAASFELDFDLEGVIQIPCDRCLDDMDHEVKTQETLYVKFGSEYSEESDNVVVIPESDGELNIAWFLYEFIALTIPLKHVHQAGKCNKSMSAKLRKHAARSMDDSDESEDVNARATGSSSSFDKFCKVVSNSWRLASLPAREDFDNLRIVSTRSRMCSPNASLMVSPSTLPSILTLLRNAEYCSFILPQTPHLIV